MDNRLWIFIPGFRKFRATTKPAYLTARFLNKYEDLVDLTEDDKVDKTEDNKTDKTGDNKTEDKKTDKTENDKKKDIIRKELEERDPILLSFKNASKAREKGKDRVEYQSKYQEVVEENFEFATQMLNLCKNQQEARLILKKQEVLHRYSQSNHK